MKLKPTDKELIKRTECQIRGCNEMSYGIAKSKFLCKIHYREEIPERSTNYMRVWWKTRKLKD